jgi:hypothetical protein
MDTQSLPAPAEMLSDDLKRINGIGPGLEHRLHECGIRTFAQLAAMSPAEIADRVAGLAGASAEKIAHQDWVGQARALVAEPAPTGQPAGSVSTGNRQRYATFIIELLLDEDNNVRRTRMVHVQEGQEDTWAGWTETRLLDFVTGHAALRLPATPAPASPVAEAATVAEPTPAAAPVAQLGGRLHLAAMEVVIPDSPNPRRLLRAGQPFNIHLTLDLAELVAPPGPTLNYTATVYAKSLAGGARQMITQAQGVAIPGGKQLMTMAGTPLPPGDYRLEAVVTVALPADGAHLMAYIEDELLEIY